MPNLKGLNMATLLLEPEQDAREHIGLRNVDERLKLAFGPQFGLSFASAPGFGTTVTLIIPARSGQ